jgi:hypothetical protein
VIVQAIPGRDRPDIVRFAAGARRLVLERTLPPRRLVGEAVSRECLKSGADGSWMARRARMLGCENLSPANSEVPPVIWTVEAIHRRQPTETPASPRQRQDSGSLKRVIYPAGMRWPQEKEFHPRSASLV